MPPNSHRHEAGMNTLFYISDSFHNVLPQEQSSHSEYKKSYTEEDLRELQEWTHIFII